MKRFCILFIAVIMLQGCISMGSIRNTANRLQGDIDYFQAEIERYSILIEEKDSAKARTVLKDAEEMLERAESALMIGDKIGEKKYLSALVDIMDLFEVE